MERAVPQRDTAMHGIASRDAASPDDDYAGGPRAQTRDPGLLGACAAPRPLREPSLRATLFDFTGPTFREERYFAGGGEAPGWGPGQAVEYSPEPRPECA
jgi:hypothetical protein